MAKIYRPIKKIFLSKTQIIERPQSVQPQTININPTNANNK